MRVLFLIIQSDLEVKSVPIFHCEFCSLILLVYINPGEIEKCR